MEQTVLFLGASYYGEDHQIKPEYLWLAYANRHGLITGATGTGKTITMQVLAESFSAAGVPVFCADIKGDFSGIALPGKINEKITRRAQDVGLDTLEMQGAPVIFWDIFGEEGHAVRATVSGMGPLLLARLLNLSPAQEGVLNIAFRVASEQNLLLIDLKDLQSLLFYIGENIAQLSLQYGHMSKASVATIQRELLVFEEQGGANFFGEPALTLSDFMGITADGRGIVNILTAERLMRNPRLYSTFLLWLMSELFKQLPEVGDLDKPRLIFFFDEAHLLFNLASKALIEHIEQLVRLIRSKGVGVYFVTQNPLDIAETVLGQLGNRIQHALRVYTPREMASVKLAASTFRPNPAFNTEQAIMNLATGEALVSVLEEKAIPSIVQKVMIRPPFSQIGPISKEERAEIMAQSSVASRYDRVIDRFSAYETLQQSEEMKEKRGAEAQSKEIASGKEKREKRQKDSLTETALKTATRSIASSFGRIVARETVRIVRGMVDEFLNKRNKK